MTWQVVQGDCVEAMATMAEASVEAICTDPPYGIRFMGKAWDAPGIAEGAASQRGRATNARPDTGPLYTYRIHEQPSMVAGEYDRSAGANRRFQTWCETWASEVLRVLKPGGHALVFGGPRTYHRLTCGVEDAGFEIRDCLVWLYGSGFPKSRNLDGDWDGWGTALKPAHEPIVVARKPLAGTVAANVLEHGTGALNIDGCRIDFRGDADSESATVGGRVTSTANAGAQPNIEGSQRQEFEQVLGHGRWPANVVLDEEAAAMLDEQSGDLRSGANPTRRGTDKFRDVYGEFAGQEECEPARGADAGGASRFFYCAKASGAERNAGLDGFAEREVGKLEDDAYEWATDGRGNPRSGKTIGRNPHPTVKPIDLMRWLARLITPPGGTVLDPFTGSGTTGIAAVLEGFDFIGIEREAEYVDIARARIAHWEPQGWQLGLDVA